MNKAFLFRIGLLLCLFSDFPVAAAVILATTLEPSTGGYLADDNGDGIFDRAGLSEVFLVGGGGGAVTWDREYQGSYEFDLARVGQNLQIISATLYLTRSGVTAYVTGTPNILGEAASYVGDGLFSLSDANAGTRIGTFNVWNHSIKPWPHPYSEFDVTSTMRSLYKTEDRILGFNFRSTALPSSGLVHNSFNRPTIYLRYTVIPEPSTMGLAMFGLSMLFFRKRF